LVEVLVAAVVLATGLLAGLTAFSMATRVMAASSNDTVVTFLAQEKLSEIQVLGRAGLKTGVTTGDFGPEFPGHAWELRVREPDELNLVYADLLITAREAGRTREIRFSTCVF
jgi:hypothetical protein